jgi:Colicin V production protein
MMIMVLMAFFIIGYLSGATVEIIRLIQVVVPFLVVFYFGGFFARIIFKSKFFNQFIMRIKILQDFPYFNTIVMMLSTILAFYLTYIVTGFLIKRLQKVISTEILAYKLGKFNKSLGAFLAGVRFYILASVFILPFFLINVTNKETDVITNVVLEHPPGFTRVGRLVNASEPVLNATNSLTGFLEVIDLRELKQYYDLLTDMDGTLEGLEANVTEQYKKLSTNLNINEEDAYAIVAAFSEDPNTFIDAASNQPELQQKFRELQSQVEPYNGIIQWANTAITKEDANQDTIVSQFKEDYELIIDMTDDPVMKEDLKKARQYIIIEDWLSKNEIQVDSNNLQNLLSDTNVELIVNQLVLEPKNDGLIFKLRQLNDESLNRKLDRLEQFIADYNTTYSKIMKDLKIDMPFTYKLIAATMKNVNFIESLERSPVMAMYIIDTINLFEGSGVVQFGDDTIYQTIMKVMFPLYLVQLDEQGDIITIDKNRMTVILNQVDHYLDQVILTEEFVNQLVEGLVAATYYDNENQKDKPYIHYLIETNRISPEALQLLKEHELFKNASFHDELARLLLTVGEEQDV